MALQKTLTLPDIVTYVEVVIDGETQIEEQVTAGAVYADAYGRIVFYQGWKDRLLLHFNWYVSEEDRLANADPVHQGIYELAVAVGDSVSQPEMYAYLKTLPAFAGAVDV
jgi:hypothetical protein